MTTIVSFHAHPDDESIQTGGTLARAARDGHRVILVVATRGELGEVADGFLDHGEALGDRRVVETQASAQVLGIDRVAFLGFHDSGMMDEPSNDDPACFWQADVEEAAIRLASILREEEADVLIAYDDHGGYGHPDHIQVHRVGHRAAQLAGTPHVLEATMNRDHFHRLMSQIEPGDAGGERDDEEANPAAAADFGTPEAEISTTVDVSAFVEIKRASMRAHASQITEESMFLAMPDDVFVLAFGQEWFLHVVGAGQPGEPEWLLRPTAGQDGGTPVSDAQELP